MNIAVIGWGSLIWSPRQLDLRSLWHADGPCLPVEFARASADGRVTLVLMEGRKTVRTYWALSASNNLDEVIENLRSRERTNVTEIHSFPKSTGEECDAVGDWLGERSGLDAAVWTGLAPTFGTERLVQAVVAHLNGLTGPARSWAQEYVEFAPRQIITPVRNAIEYELGWRARQLPRHLFNGSDMGPPCNNGK